MIKNCGRKGWSQESLEAEGGVPSPVRPTLPLLIHLTTASKGLYLAWSPSIGSIELRTDAIHPEPIASPLIKRETRSWYGKMVNNRLRTKRGKRGKIGWRACHVREKEMKRVVDTDRNDSHTFHAGRPVTSPFIQ